MATIILQLDPSRLANPNVDIRYLLPDLLVERTGGRLVDDAYDYVGDDDSPCMLLILRTDDPAGVVPRVIEVLKSERVLDNDLSDVPVAVEEGLRFAIREGGRTVGAGVCTKILQ